MRRTTVLLVACTAMAVLRPARSAAQAADAPGYGGPTNGVVRLPWADFRELLDRLRSLQQPEETAPPAPVVVGGATYRIAVDADERQAKVDAEIDLVVLQHEGWIDLPLLPDSAALEAFAVDGGAGTLTQRDGFHRLIARADTMNYGTPTARRATLSYRVNVERDGGPHGLTVPLVEAGITRLELTLPRADQDVRIEPGGVVLQRTTGATGTTIVALVPRTAQALLHWSDRAAPVREEAVRAIADVVHRVAFQRHVVSGEVTVSLQVERGSFEAVVLRFPKEAEGIRTTGDFSIDLAPDADGSQLATVRAGYARRDATQFVVRYELQRDVGRITAPAVAVVKLIQAGEDRDVVRQSGFLVLYADEGMEVASGGAPTGAEPCDVSEAPGTTMLTGQAVTAFRTSGQPYVVPLTVTRHEERAVLASAAQSARLDLVINREGKAVGDLVLDVQNNERQYVGVWLPRQAQLWATFVRGLPVKPSGEQEWVMIPVPHSTLGPDGVPETIPVEVLYYQDAPRIDGLWGEGAFDVPRVDLLVSGYSVAVWAPEEFRYFAFEGNAKPAQESLGPAGATIDNLSTEPPAYRFAFEQNAENVRASLRPPTEPEAAENDKKEELPAGGTEDQTRQRDLGGRFGPAAGLPAQPSGAADHALEPYAALRGARTGDAGAMAEDEERKAQEATSQATTLAMLNPASRGLLPIRVDVPREGLALRFSRSLVEPKAATTIGFRFQARGLLRTFPWLRLLAGLLLALGLARVAHRSIVRRRFSSGTLGPVAFAAGLVLAAVLSVLLYAPLGGAFWALGAGLAFYGAVLGGVLLWRYLRRRSPFGPPPPPVPGAPPQAAPPPSPPVPPAPAGAEVGP